MGGGQDESVRGDHHAASAALGGAPGSIAPPDAEGSHGGRELLDHSGDHARVGIERLVLVRGMFARRTLLAAECRLQKMQIRHWARG